MLLLIYEKSWSLRRADADTPGPLPHALQSLGIQLTCHCLTVSAAQFGAYARLQYDRAIFWALLTDCITALILSRTAPPREDRISQVT